MLSRIVSRSLTRRRRPKLLSVVAVALGIAVATAVATIALDVGDKVSRELRSFGANIAITPAADSLAVTVGGVDYRPARAGVYLAEADLVKLKKIFWRNNIMAFAPFLYVPAGVADQRVILIGTWFEKEIHVDKSEVFRTGLKQLHPAWKVEGQWPKDEDSGACLVGRRLADRLGVRLGQPLTIESMAPLSTAANARLKSLRQNPVLPAAGPLAVRKGSAFPRGTVLQFKKSSAPLPDPAAGVSARRGGTAAPPSEAFTQALKATATSVELTVRGILQTGGSEDDQILAPLALVQKFAGLEGKFRRAEVSALTKPEDAFAHSDVTKLSPEEFDRWYCTPYVSSIAYQIQQAIPAAQAKAVYQVAETEGRILDRTGLLMALLAGAALVAAALAVASMMLATVHERRAEIGLFKSLGATETRIAAIFLLEAAAIGFIGGLVGYAAGSVLARQLAIVVFGSPARVHWILFAPSVALALLLTLVGSAIPLARGLQVSPALSLRNE